jgi:phosphoribosyl 1,2-cyclic phosphodiesterase
MLSITVLGSGSSGNCAVIRTDRSRFLVDAGLSARRITQRLEEVGLSVSELDGILLTHEHGDHTAGLEILCRKYEVPLYCTALTQETLLSGFAKAKPKWRLMQTGSAFDFQDLRIECFPVPHDAVDPVGFLIQDEESRLGVLSDVGFITNLIRDRLKGVHTLFMEANYDGPLLEADTKRPWATKQRISGRHGHLSNEQAAELVQHLAHEGLNHVVLGHLSEDCNCPNVARQKILAALQAGGAVAAQVLCANRHGPTPWLEVARRQSCPPVAPGISPGETVPVETAPTPPPSVLREPAPAFEYQPMEQLGLWGSLGPAR